MYANGWVTVSLADKELGVRLGSKFLCGKSLPSRLQSTFVEIIMIAILCVNLDT